MNCPHCKELCDREEVDVGVGVIHGPWGCPNCGWSEHPEYDCRDGIRKDGADRVLDQYGVSHHVTRPAGQAVLAGMNVLLRGDEVDANCDTISIDALHRAVDEFIIIDDPADHHPTPDRARAMEWYDHTFGVRKIAIVSHPPPTASTTHLRQAVWTVVVEQRCSIGYCGLGYGVLHPMWHSETWWQP